MNTDEKLALDFARDIAMDALRGVDELRTQVTRITDQQGAAIVTPLVNLQMQISELQTRFDCLSRQVDSLAAKELL